MDFILSHPVLFTILFLKLEGIRIFLEVFLAIFSAALLTGSVIYLYNKITCLERAEFPDCKSYKDALRYKNVFGALNTKLILGIFLLMFLNFIVPSQREAAIIVGVSTGAEVITSIKNSPLSDKAFKALSVYIEESLDEVIDKGKK